MFTEEQILKAGELGEISLIDVKHLIVILKENFNNESNQVQAGVKQAACGKWQRKKPDKPCYFIHRYNKKDRYPSLFEADIDTDVLCVYNIQDDEFVETMEGFADGQFFIIEK